MAKTLIRLSILIGIAISAVVLMYFISNRKIIDDPKIESTIVKVFKRKCDSLQAAPWNKNNYENLKIELESLKTEKVVSMDDGIKLAEYLDLAFAKSLQESWNNWKDSNGDTTEPALLKAMEEIKNKPHCTPFVEKEIEVMNCFYRSLNIPSQVSFLISKEFNNDDFNKLEGEIYKNCGREEIKHFNKLINIKNESIKELNSFKEFSNDFTQYFANYQENPEDFDYVDDLKSLCEDSRKEIIKYRYYRGKLQALPGICN